MTPNSTDPEFHERMKLLMDRWIDLATELSTLRLSKEKDKIMART